MPSSDATWNGAAELCLYDLACSQQAMPSVGHRKSAQASRANAPDDHKSVQGSHRKTSDTLSLRSGQLRRRIWEIISPSQAQAAVVEVLHVCAVVLPRLTPCVADHGCASTHHFVFDVHSHLPFWKTCGLLGLASCDASSTMRFLFFALMRIMLTFFSARHSQIALERQPSQYTFAYVCPVFQAMMAHITSHRVLRADCSRRVSWSIPSTIGYQR